MADSDQNPEVATKAPESDAAAETSTPTIPGDTPAQTGASMGEHCTSDRPSPTGEEPSGTMTKLADVDCYISKPSDYPQTPSKLLLLLSSGTGVHSKNNQLQADRFAAEGYLVVMPDQFNNDPAPVTRQKDVELVDPPQSPSTIEQIKLGIAKTLHGASATFQVDMWLARQTPEKCLPLLLKVVTDIKAEYADAVAYGGGLYAVGYCFGGRYVLLLGGETASKTDGPAANVGQAQGETGRNRSAKNAGSLMEREGEDQSKPTESTTSQAPETLIKAGALAHGTQVQEADMKNCKAPVSLVCVEDDPWFPDEIREAGKKHLEEQGTQHELQMYPGVPHGFAVVGEYEEEHIQEAQKKAFTQMLDWLKAH